MSRPFKIDAHSHILPEHLPDFEQQFGYPGFISLEHHAPGKAWMWQGGKRFREINANCWDPAQRIEEYAAWGVDVQVVSTIPVMFSYWAPPADALEAARFLNDDMAKVAARHPRHYIPLGTVPLQDVDRAIGEMERCVKELGFPGLQIGSHVNQWNLGDAELFPFFEAAQDLGCALMIHPWDMMGKAEMEQYWLPWLVGMPAETTRAICSMIFGGVFERLPGLRVYFSHGGGAFAFTLGRIEHGFNVRPDLVAVDNPRNPRDYVGRFWVDSIFHDPKAFHFALDLFGAERIMMGSDYPFPLGELEPGKMISELESIDEPTRQTLLADAALDWLQLDPAPFADS